MDLDLCLSSFRRFVRDPLTSGDHRPTTANRVADDVAASGAAVNVPRRFSNAPVRIADKAGPRRSAVLVEKHASHAVLVEKQTLSAGVGGATPFAHTRATRTGSRGDPLLVRHVPQNRGVLRQAAEAPATRRRAPVTARNLYSRRCTMNIFWFLPTHGDGRYLGTPYGARAVSYRYLKQIAEAADDLGFGGVLLPTGRSCEDAWAVASSLIAATRNLRFLVAIRPGIISPTAAARLTSTVDRLSEGRLLINVVTGGDPAEAEGDGIFLSHDARYAVTSEFLEIWKRVLAGETVDFEGQHLRVKGAKILYPPVQTPHPPLYIGGSSDVGHDLAARHHDVYLTWGEPPPAVARKIADVRRRAELHGRRIRFGIRLHVIVRETNDAAWRAADELIARLDDSAIQAAQQAFARFDSEGQRLMSALHRGKRDQLEVSPNLWAGVGLVRGGAGTALVGDPPTVAERMQEYADLGIDTFILSGYPHLEEAYRVAELLFPRLPLDQKSAAGPISLTGPFGEMIANEHAPRASAS